MTIQDKHKIPAQTNDGDAASAAQPLSDDSLEGLAGGTTDMADWPSCTTAEELSEEKIALVEAYNKSQTK